MKVVKYLSYVERGCGNYSMMAKSLGHCKMVLFVGQQ